MKVSSLSKNQWRRLILNLQQVANELKQAKQENEKQEEGEIKDENRA